MKTKIEVGVPKRQILIEAGYDETKVDEWLKEDATAPTA